MAPFEGPHRRDSRHYRVAVASRFFPPPTWAVDLRGASRHFSRSSAANSRSSSWLRRMNRPPQGSCEQWILTHGGHSGKGTSGTPRLARGTGTLLRNVDPDVVYLNSLFDVRFSGIPLMYLRIARTGVPVLLAPRGELSPGALRLKRPRKRAFLLIFRLLRLHRYVEWQASSDLEGSHIRERFGKRVTVHLAPPLSSHEPEEEP